MMINRLAPVVSAIRDSPLATTRPIRDFVAELLDVAPATVKVGHAESIATWTLELDYAAKYTVSNITTHGTRFRASDLVEQSADPR